MKIAIPVNENKSETSVCISFGRAPYFMLHDTEEKTTEYIANTAADEQGGAGLKAAQLIVDSGANILLTIRCGQNAAEALNAAQIKIYKADGLGAAENLAALQEGKLMLMTQFHSGFHGHQ
jgi:predicted Fe-Mo cluster-binding NifX family protein